MDTNSPAHVPWAWLEDMTHFTYLSYFDHDVQFLYWHSPQKNLFWAPYVGVNWEWWSQTLKRLIVLQLLCEILRYNVTTLTSLMKMWSHFLKKKINMSCIYEGYWIYGFGVFCFMRPFLRARPPKSYSDVCLNFGAQQFLATVNIHTDHQTNMQMVLYPYRLGISIWPHVLFVSAGKHHSWDFLGNREPINDVSWFKTLT